MRVGLRHHHHGACRTLRQTSREAIAQHPPLEAVTAESLALYTQTVLQGGFVLSKATGDRAPLLDAIAHLKQLSQAAVSRSQGERGDTM